MGPHLSQPRHHCHVPHPATGAPGCLPSLMRPTPALVGLGHPMIWGGVISLGESVNLCELVFGGRHTDPPKRKQTYVLLFFSTELF